MTTLTLTQGTAVVHRRTTARWDDWFLLPVPVRQQIGSPGEINPTECLPSKRAKTLGGDPARSEIGLRL